MNLDQLSVEEFISRCSFHVSNYNDIQSSLILDSTLPNNSRDNDLFISSVPIEHLDPKNCGIEKDELDKYLSTTNNVNSEKNDRGSNSFTPVMLGRTEPNTNENSSNKIEIVYGLESSYKSRYKRDYFATNGQVRKPRYVADVNGHHYVTLKMKPGTTGLIRVDWVTIPDERNIHYLMPYKFQTDNDSLSAEDTNPIYYPIQSDENGIIKLYLVLIKSKQDDLKNLQYLQIFPTIKENHFELINKNESPLSPKQLIKNFHLDKSQLAFTYCQLDSDKTTFIPNWSTTVYSTVLQEISSTESTTKTVNPPQYFDQFPISVESANSCVEEPKAKRRKVAQNKLKTTG